MLKCSQWAPPSCMSTNGFDPVSIPVAQCGRDVIVHADMIRSCLHVRMLDGACHINCRYRSACSRRLSVGTAASRTDQAPRIRDATCVVGRALTAIATKPFFKNVREALKRKESPVSARIPVAVPRRAASRVDRPTRYDIILEIKISLDRPRRTD